MHVGNWVRKLTLERLVTAIVFIAIFTMAVRVPADSDSWWHLQSGRWMVEQRQLLQTDLFSHTRLGEPWVNHSWLAQLILYLAYALLDYAGLALLVAALVTLAFYFVWQQVEQTDRWLRAFGMILAATTSGVIWAARPQMFSFLLTAVFAALLYRYRQGEEKVLWALPPIMVLWVNLHGGFAAGFILLIATLFGGLVNQLLRQPGLSWRALGKLTLVTLICLLLVPLNPNGITMWGYPFRTVNIGVLQDFIAEWRPPDFHQHHLHPFIWLLMGTLAALGLSGRRVDFTDLTLVALFGYMSLLAGRNIALFALVAAPLAIREGSAAFASWRQRLGRPANVRPPSRELPLLNWLLLALILLAALLKLSQPLNPAVSEEIIADLAPVEAVDYLDEHNPPGPIFNSYNWGGYLIWQLPAYPVYVDGRTDLYDDPFLRDYLSIVFAQQGWQAKLDSAGINTVLIESQSMLARMLALQPDWQEAYQDEMAVIYTRR